MSIKSTFTNFFKVVFGGFIKRNGSKFVDLAFGLALGFASVLMGDESLSGKQKKDLVLKQLKESLAIHGKEIATSELNLLIEFAVEKIKTDNAAKSES